MKYKVKLTLSIKFALTILFFLFLVALVFIYGYFNHKSKIENEFNEEVIHDTQIIYKELSDNLLKSSQDTTQTMLLSVIKTTPISSIKITYKRFLFSKETLMRNSNYIQNGEWQISDVATDIKNGTVVTHENDIYELSASKNVS